MKIAVPVENGQIFGHFGRTERFRLYEVEHGDILKVEERDTEGNGHGALAGLLAAWQVNEVVCGGMGEGMRNALANRGILVHGGVTGDADEAIRALLAGTLVCRSSAGCDHHDGGCAHN